MADESTRARDGLREFATYLKRLGAVLATFGVALSLAFFLASLPKWVVQAVLKVLGETDPDRNMLSALTGVGFGGAGAMLIAALWRKVASVLSPVWEYLENGQQYLMKVVVPAAIVLALSFGTFVGAAGVTTALEQARESAGMPRAEPARAVTFAKVNLTSGAVRQLMDVRCNGNAPTSAQALIDALAATTLRVSTTGPIAVDLPSVGKPEGPHVEPAVDRCSGDDFCPGLAAEIGRLADAIRGDRRDGKERGIHGKLASIDQQLGRIAEDVAALSPHGVPLEP
jgi:hypothetical protein